MLNSFCINNFFLLLYKILIKSKRSQTCDHAAIAADEWEELPEIVRETITCWDVFAYQKKFKQGNKIKIFGCCVWIDTQQLYIDKVTLSMQASLRSWSTVNDVWEHAKIVYSTYMYIHVALDKLY